MDWNRVLEVIFPAQCASCDAFGSGLCDACVPRTAPSTRRLASLRVTALGSYEGALRSAILALKDGRRDVATALADRMIGLCGPDAIIVPVPTTAARRRARGMDGVIEIVRAIARRGNLEPLLALTQRRGDTQRGRTREHRLAAHGRFSAEPALVAGRRVLLVDDVCTTGATLEDCAAAIRAAGGYVEEAVVGALA